MTSIAGNALSSNKSVACHACRDRKTRCVGSPICQYCAKNNLLCSRSEERPVTHLDQWGQKIISAIHNAKQEVISASSASATSADQSIPAQCQHTSPSIANFSSLALDQRWNLGKTTSESASHTSTIILYPSSLTSGLILPRTEAILSWPVWRLNPGEIFSLLSEHRPSVISKHDYLTSLSASTSLDELKRWQSNFVRRFLGSYPIVDETELHRLTTVIAEKGAAWNSSTCKLLLTCALGAQCWPTRPESQSSRDPGQGYWNMAKRRLGWVLDEDSIESTQSFVLAGLWHLHNFEPYKARKMLFHGSRITQILASSVPPEIHAVCSTLYCKVTVGLGLQIQPTGSTDRSDEEDFLGISNGNNLGESSKERRNRPHSTHEAWASLQPIYSQCIQLNKDIPSDPSWYTLVLVFNNLSSLGLQLEDWRRTLSDSLQQLLMANFNFRDESQGIPPARHQDQAGEDQDELDLVVFYREVKLLLLLPALFFILSPILTKRLSQPTCPLSLAEQLLNRIVTEANSCLHLAMVGIDEVSRHMHKNNLHGSSTSTSPYPYQQFRGNDEYAHLVVESCNHVHLWLLFRCASRSGLVLLAGLCAHTKAMRSVSSDSGLCASLQIPDDLHTTLENLARSLLEYPEGTDLWSSGRLLLRLYQDFVVNAASDH